jgi:hypothetical protein
MTQSELNRAVARATGESAKTVAQMGFVPLTEHPYEREPQILDCERADASRRVSLQRQRRRPAV